MKTLSWMTVVAALAAATPVCAVRAHAGLFKLDFGTFQNSVSLTDWDTISEWSFKDFSDGIATWKLTDFSPEKNTNVTLTIMDNAPLSAKLGSAPPLGMSGNNPDPQGLDVVYDGIKVPAAVKDDYLWRNPSDGSYVGFEMLFRFANLAPGQYHVTLFEGRVSDVNGQYGKIWIDGVNGTKEPAEQNTGDFSANPLTDPSDPNSLRVPNPWGNPKTLVVDIQAGDFLWYAHMEDEEGGISGMVIRSWVDSDGDGLPDDWETLWGLNPRDPSDAAKDLNGNGLSNSLEYQSALDPADTTRPTIRSVVANSVANELVLTFSKPLFARSASAIDPRDPTLATNLANYSISPTLAITGVAVLGNVVTITTAKPNPDISAYTLTVNNLRDVNNWPVAPNSTVTFSMGTDPTSTQPLIYHWFTIAGKAGSTGSADGTNGTARFKGPQGVAADAGGNLFVTDSGNSTIRNLTRVGTNWVTTTIAGLAGSTGRADGTNRNARFGGYNGQLVVDSGGNLYLGDLLNNTVRKITSQGTDWVTTTIAGKAGVSGSADGTNSNARFNLPNGIALDAGGDLLVVDGLNSTIRNITSEGTNWVTTTIAGSAGHPGSTDGTGSAARFNFSVDANGMIAVDSGGHVFVTDPGNHTIRKLTREGTNWVTTTIAGKSGVPGSTDGIGSAARFRGPNGVAVDGVGNVFVAGMQDHTIRKLMPAGTNWLVTTIGGSPGISGSANGTNSVARFDGPMGLAADSAGNLYVAEWGGNNTIRMGVPLPVFEGVRPANDHVELIVNAAPGQRVQLQYSSDLSSATWSNLGNPITATSGLISATDTPSVGQPRFYRALVVR